jgi:hypothetical protein
MGEPVKMIELHTCSEVEVGWIKVDGRGLPIAEPYPIGVRIDGGVWFPLDDIVSAAEKLKNG